MREPLIWEEYFAYLDGDETYGFPEEVPSTKDVGETAEDEGEPRKRTRVRHPKREG